MILALQRMQLRLVMTWIGNWDAYSVQKGNIVTISKDTKPSKSTSQLPDHRIKGNSREKGKGSSSAFLGLKVIHIYTLGILSFKKDPVHC